MVHLDNDMKKQINDYTDVKTQLTNLNKKQEGGFISKDLTEVFIQNNIRKDDLPQTRLLTTLIAIVGK